MFVLDGQHRIEMFKKLKEKNHDFSKISIPVVIYNIDTLDELKSYYERINKHHPINPLQLNTSEWIYGKPFFEWFSKKFPKYISNSKQCRCPNFNMDDIMSHFERFKIIEKIDNIHNFISNIDNLNNYILKNKDTLVVNAQGCKDLSMNFEKCIRKSQLNPCVLGIWRNYQWIELALYMSSENENWINTKLDIFSKERPKISQDLRLDVWNKRNRNIYNEDHHRGKCFCCSDELKYSNMECGHIVPHVKGGSIDLNNLEPICRGCNTQMGIMNLNEFKDCILTKV